MSVDKRSVLNIKNTVAIFLAAVFFVLLMSPVNAYAAENEKI